MTVPMTRREATAFLGAALVAPPALAQNELLTRAIPSGGERLPAVGLGTAGVFGSGEGARQIAGAVVEALLAGGGRLIDTASVYGEAEAVRARSLPARMYSIDVEIVSNMRCT